MTPERLREIEKIISIWLSDYMSVVPSTVKVARAIAPVIEAARAEGQKDMQERCRQVAAGDSATFNFTKAWDECRDSEAGAASARKEIAAAIAALSDTELSCCDHDWKIWPETDGQEQRCMKCGKYRKTVSAVDGANQIQSPPAPSAEPVAWIAFAGNGNVRFWTADPERAAKEKQSGLDLRMFTLSELIALVSRIPPALDREAVATLAETLRAVSALFDDEGNFVQLNQDQASVALEKLDRALSLLGGTR